MKQSFLSELNHYLRAQPGMSTVIGLSAALRRKLSTVGRTLRKLRAQGKARSQSLPGRRKGWQALATPVPGRLAASTPTRQTLPRKDSSTMSLETSVQCIVIEFTAAQKTFSAHDVTTELRKRVRWGTLSVATGQALSDGTAVVDHTAVRDLVHGLFSTGKMPGYDRTHTGTYWRYAPVIADTPIDPGGSSGIGYSDPASTSDAAPIADAADYCGDPTLG